MPLTDKPANAAGTKNTASPGKSRKRGLDAFLQPVAIAGAGGQSASGSPLKSPSRNGHGVKQNQGVGSDKENTPFKKTLASSSPPIKTPGLTDSGSSPLDRAPPSPNTPTKQSFSSSTSSTVPLSTATSNVISTPTTSTAAASANNDEPPKKKKRASAAEMKERQEELEKKKQEKELAERLKTEEKDKKRREKEEAEKLKAEEKEKKRREKEEADKAKNEEKEKKRKEKEEKERKKREKEEEAAKKARSQLTLTGMFGKTISIPQRAAAAAPAKNEAAQAKTPSKDKDAPVSVYDQMFKPFFVKEHVKLAPNPCDLDDEAREHKTRVLEEYVAGKRASKPEGDNGNNNKFDPVEVLQIPFKIKRGRVYPSVKKIMKEFTTESSQTPQTQHLRELLKTVPVKSLKFYQDVRPPYIGTISGLPPGVKSLRKVSRNPFSRNVLPLAYDYDSEAEWQDEEGEDVDDLDDEDEIEGLEGDEDMDDFLDDADDTGPSRMVFSGGMEPEITGLCWENKKRMPSELRMCKFRMEFIHDKLEHHHTIDPFSTIYWVCPKAAAKSSEAATSTSPSSKTAGNPVGNSSMPPPPTAPTDAFQALGATGASGRTKKSQQLLPIEFQEKLKAMVRAKPTLSKVGVIELFVAEHPSLVKGQVKNSFDALIVKVGKEHKVKGE